MDKQRLLLISLDGLSRSDLASLSEYTTLLPDHKSCFDLSSADGQPVTSLQSLWAEILTGGKWNEVGCPGYRRPGSSLNTCQVVSEDDLLAPVSLLQANASQLALLVNMPLLSPSHPGRVWLSDGSIPSQTAVSPSALLSNPLFAGYKARPYLSVAQALTDLSEAVNRSLAVENQRLECALDLITRYSWQICFLRLTVFDQLAHLLGPDFLRSSSRLVWPSIKEFLINLDKKLTEIFRLSSGAHICLLSTFGHSDCRARLNVNQLLAHCGFLNFSGGDVFEQTLSRRRQASAAVNLLRRPAEKNTESRVAISANFETSRTLAASPIYGMIYLNLKSRFEDGIVLDEEATSLLKSIRENLNTALIKEFGMDDYLIEPGSTNKLKKQPAMTSAPDLVLSVRGVELHDLINSETVDWQNRPRSTHDYNGFVFLPQNLHRPLAKGLSTLDLHKHLMELIE